MAPNPLRLTVVFFAMSISTLAQSYSGYLNVNGQGSTPVVSYQAGAVLTCAAGYSSIPQSYPPGCDVNACRYPLTAGLPHQALRLVICSARGGISKLYIDGHESWWSSYSASSAYASTTRPVSRKWADWTKRRQSTPRCV
jgi:hypothetical protein